MLKIPLQSVLACNITGLIFSAGWWSIIDGLYLNSEMASDDAKFSKLILLFPILSTVGVALLSSGPRKSIISSNSSTWGENDFMSRIMLLLAIIIVLAGMSISVTIYFVSHHSEEKMVEKLPAAMIPIGTTLIALAGLGLKFLRANNEEDGMF